VLGATCVVGARCAWGFAARRGWSLRDAALARAWVAAIDVQVLLGMLLYFFASPQAAIARQSLRWAWADPSLRFFGIQHPLAMLAVAASTHVSWVWARRTDGATRERFRRLGLGVLGTLVLILAAIPWPSLTYGRPLARFPWP
jgi:hypothetical protein